MKKILLLGGSYFQIPSIITAKKLGYYAVTCDYLPENPGHKFADEYHNVSTTDKDAVLALAKNLNVDGVVCYASDPAATTAAYVSEKLGFPTSPYESIEILSNKDKFRDFLAANNFNTPKAKGFSESEFDKISAEISNFKFPIMIKPVDSSGSKGVKKIDRVEDLADAFNWALKYSRCKRVVIEEYIEKQGYVIGGNGFSVNGEMKFICLTNKYFDVRGINPYTPIGNMLPCSKSEHIQQKVKSELQRMLNILQMQTQAYNFDIIIDKNENVYMIDIGARCGGNMVPDVIKYATGVDLVEYTIKAAMGESCEDLHQIDTSGYWATHVVHSSKAGIFNRLWIDENIKNNNVVENNIYVKTGDKIPAFVDSNGTLGIIIMKFGTQAEMFDTINNIENKVAVLTE